MKSTILPLAAAALSATMVTSGNLDADNACKFVDVVITNNATDQLGNGGPVVGVDINVKKIEYYDYEDKKWRTEEVSNTEIPYRDIESPPRQDLEHVGGQKIKVRVVYDYRVPPGGNWTGPILSPQTSPKVCQDYDEYYLTINRQF